MSRRSLILAICLVVTGMVLFIFVGKSFSDNVGSPYTGQLASNIRAWYDESWEASGFYRLRREANPQNFIYEYTTTPTNNSTPTYVEGGTDTDKQTTEESSHRHTVSDSPGAASIPQDIVVTEWKVSGHVHFASGI
jgi:hypothetical protein